MQFYCVSLLLRINHPLRYVILPPGWRIWVGKGTPLHNKRNFPIQRLVQNNFNGKLYYPSKLCLPKVSQKCQNSKVRLILKIPRASQLVYACIVCRFNGCKWCSHIVDLKLYLFFHQHETSKRETHTCISMIVEVGKKLFVYGLLSFEKDISEKWREYDIHIIYTLYVEVAEMRSIRLYREMHFIFS